MSAQFWGDLIHLSPLVFWGVSQEGPKTGLVHSARFLVNRAEWTFFRAISGPEMVRLVRVVRRTCQTGHSKRADSDSGMVLPVSGSRIGQLPEQSRPALAWHSRVIAQLACQSGEQLPDQLSIIDSWSLALSHKLRWWGIMHQSASSFAVTASVTSDPVKYRNP